MYGNTTAGSVVLVILVRAHDRLHSQARPLPALLASLRLPLVGAEQVLSSPHAHPLLVNVLLRVEVADPARAVNVRQVAFERGEAVVAAAAAKDGAFVCEGVRFDQSAVELEGTTSHARPWHILVAANLPGDEGVLVRVIGATTGDPPLLHSRMRQQRGPVLRCALASLDRAVEDP